ncbi:unnamed protein product [Dovyalis caffra]|uniref:Uncharacterized protein n=1 Tax=Dovyalis caffra TaxID=77055 RepID=A0AAV1QX35_9ROSI|nr:unnamed protein product [Dovyalis caffra]
MGGTMWIHNPRTHKMDKFLNDEEWVGELTKCDSSTSNVAEMRRSTNFMQFLTASFYMKLIMHGTCRGCGKLPIKRRGALFVDSCTKFDWYMVATYFTRSLSLSRKKKWGKDRID